MAAKLLFTAPEAAEWGLRAKKGDVSPVFEGLDEFVVVQVTDQLPAGRTPTKSDWHRISAHWRVRLDEQVAALEALRDKLDSCIGCGCLSLKQCSISNPADRAASSPDAPGAAFLPPALRRQPR